MRKRTINLKEEIKQLIFPPSGPVCVSEDEGLFKVVMSTFFQHEQMVIEESVCTMLFKVDVCHMAKCIMNLVLIVR